MSARLVSRSIDAHELTNLHLPPIRSPIVPPHRTRHRHTPPQIMRRGGSVANGITGQCISPYSPLTTVLVIQMGGLRLLTCQPLKRCTCHFYAHPCLLQLRASSAMAKRKHTQLVPHTAYVRSIDRMYILSAVASAVQVVADASATLFARE